MTRRLPLFARVALVVSGALHAAVGAAYQVMNPDGVAYLDIAEAYTRGDWNRAVNAVWSPLYSWILGAVSILAPESVHWEFPVVHVTNFGIYVAALAAFEFYWRQLTGYSLTGCANDGPRNPLLLPDWAWQALGYSLFAYSSLLLIEVTSVTPDMLMAALVLVAAGILVQLRRGPQTPPRFALIGVVLGGAYLAKSIMFPLALVALALALLTVEGIRRRVTLGLVAVALFGLTAGPFVFVISQAKGRFTIGEASRITYVRIVNGVPYPHWQGSPELGQTLVHPSRQVLDDPRVFEFATPIQATHAVSFDPSYWYEGVTPRLSLPAQIRIIRSNLAMYAALFFPEQAILVLLVCAGLWRPWRPVRVFRVLRQYSLTILAAMALGAYALVLVEGRYVGPFIPLLWGDLLANLRATRSSAMHRLATIGAALVVVSLVFPVLKADRDSARALSLFVAASPEQRALLLPTWPNEIAEELHALGVAPGSQVAVIGYGPASYWARLAKVRIVAEMFGWESESFWRDAETRARATRAFEKTGAVAIVAESVYTEVPREWHRVGTSYDYIYLLGRRSGADRLIR